MENIKQLLSKELEQFKNKKYETPISKTFCVLPWIHLSTRPSGEMRVCCNANSGGVGKELNEYAMSKGIGMIRQSDGKPSDLNTTSFLDAWNSMFMRNIRNTMLNGNIPESCVKCFEEESVGIISKRIWETLYWNTQLDLAQLTAQTQPDGSVEPKVRYLDLRLSNICNLQCAMCSPHDSSAWVPIWKNIKIHSTSKFVENYADSWTPKNTDKNGVYTWHESQQFLKDFFTQIQHFKQLYFAGGEPFMTKSHYQILEKCIESGFATQIDLRYNTNLTFLPQKLLKLWESFKSVRVICSIDGIDKINHYVRYPTKWESIVSNLRTLDNTGNNISVSLACCLNVFNIFNFDEFVKWKVTQNYKKINIGQNGTGLINWHLVYTPSILNICVLPKNKKELIREKIENLKIWLLENYNTDPSFINDVMGFAKLDKLIDYLFSEDWSNKLSDTKAFIHGIDKERNLNIENYIPEAAFLKYYD